MLLADEPKRTLLLSRPIQPMVLDANYISLKNQVIKVERRVLKELGFCVHVKHPHKVGPIVSAIIACSAKLVSGKVASFGIS